MFVSNIIGVVEEGEDVAVEVVAYHMLNSARLKFEIKFPELRFPTDSFLVLEEECRSKRKRI